MSSKTSAAPATYEITMRAMALLLWERAIGVLGLEGRQKAAAEKFVAAMSDPHARVGDRMGAGRELELAALRGGAAHLLSAYAYAWASGRLGDEAALKVAQDAVLRHYGMERSQSVEAVHNRLHGLVG
jgi:hypothetical protein